MADIQVELNERFAPHNNALSADISGELQSILRLHSISPQELFYKWESYSMKMGMEDNKMNLQVARDFKKDIQETLERESRGKMHVRASDKKGATPRTIRSGGGGDVFDMMEGITPNSFASSTTNTAIKRRNNFETPTSKAQKAHMMSSPNDNTPRMGSMDLISAGSGKPFAERANAGQIIETLNGQIALAADFSKPYSDPRIKLKANTDLSKFTYKPMAMKISEASEILDDRIDEFLALVQNHYDLDDGSFGNPTVQSTSEMVVVGRVAVDASEGKLSGSSVVLETSRRTGAGLRVPLKLDRLARYELFPGKIVALRGINASGEYFQVSEMLELPLLPPAATTISDIDNISTRLSQNSEDDDTDSRPLNIIISSGPYTTDADLSYAALDALCDRAIATCADALIILGPFLDIEHPLVATGAFSPFPPAANINLDTATLTDVFRVLITAPLLRLTQALPAITIIMVPSVRDAVNKHVSWPQDRLTRKEFGLPKQVSIVTNPVTLSLNETVIAISTQDVLFELRAEECTGGSKPAEQQNLLARLSRNLIEQRHFYPIFPPTSTDNLPKPSAIQNGDAQDVPVSKATGAMLDISYLALAEWHAVRPDVLITPSALAPFAKVVESVTVINPGQLSKKRGAGTFAQMTVEPRRLSEEERAAEDVVGHRLFERARVDVVRI